MVKKLGISARAAVLLLLTAQIALLMSSCAESAPYYADVGALYVKMTEAADLSQMYVLDSETIRIDYGIRGEHVKQLCVANSSKVTDASEIFICEAADAESLDFIVAKLNSRRSRKMNELRDYENNPGRQEQWLNLERAEVFCRDMFVFYMVMDDRGVLVEIVDSAEAPAK